MTAKPDPSPSLAGERSAVMATLAEAPAELLEAAVADLLSGLTVTEVRPPEIGLVMVRGRMGGGGRPFNLGEATVTRCTIRLSDGAVGVAHLLGRDRRRARLAAIADALWQRPESCADVVARIVAPVRAARSADDDRVRAETAATRVDFFTMVRGENR